MKRKRVLLALVSTMLLGSTAAMADSFQSLGVPINSHFSNVQDMSADGTVITGDIGYPVQAGRWTAATGWQGLGLLPNSSSVTEGLGISEDGTTVVGSDGFGGCGNNRGFKWTAATGLVELTNPGLNTLAHGANADGSVIVGRSKYCHAEEQASRWTSATGWIRLGVGGHFSSTAAYRTISDGTVLIGDAGYANDTLNEGFRWTEATGFTGLGFLPGGNRSYSAGLTADGEIVVGSSNDSSGRFQATVWSESTGLVGLGFLPGGNESFGASIDESGSVIVGRARDANNQLQAMRWTAATGMQSVKDLLTAAGVDLAGWQLTEARDISSDGKIISGNGIDPNGTSVGWIAEVSLPQIFTFIGFNSPLENLPFSNSTRAGNAVPVKFQLTDGDGNFVSDLSAVESLQYAPVACDSQDISFENPVDAIAPGASGLQFDAASNEFLYPWKTLKSQKGTCAVFRVALSDGQEHFARFWLK